MAVFAIIGTHEPEKLIAAAQAAYGADFLRLSDTACLVASSGSAMDVSRRIGLDDGVADSAAAGGSGIVMSGANYWGRATPDIWDFMNRKWST